MNIGEANDFNSLIEGLKPDATEATTARALIASERLAARAHVALHAGPQPSEVLSTVDDALARLVWGDPS